MAIESSPAMARLSASAFPAYFGPDKPGAMPRLPRQTEEGHGQVGQFIGQRPAQAAQEIEIIDSAERKGDPEEEAEITPSAGGQEREDRHEGNQPVNQIEQEGIETARLHDQTEGPQDIEGKAEGQPSEGEKKERTELAQERFRHSHHRSMTMPAQGRACAGPQSFRNWDR